MNKQERKQRMKEHMEDHIPEEAREHYKQAHQELRDSVRALFPPEFIERRRKARKEMLLAAQAMIGHAIDKLETKDA